MARRLLTIAASILILLQCSACASVSAPDIMENGADKFGSGKTEETYYFKNSGMLLDELIDKYSGSYYQPTGTAMSDDEHDDAKRAQGQSTPSGGDDTSSSSPDSSSVPDDQPSDPDGSSQPDDSSDADSSSDQGDPSLPESSDGIPEVSNMTELMRLFHTAYAQTEEYVEFVAVNGFAVDFTVDLQYIYTTLQRDDPIGVSGLQQWSYWNSGSEYYVKLIYSFDIDELKAIKAETPVLVADAVSRIGADGLSDYEIVCAVNDYLCDTVYYPPDEPYEPVTHTAYGALNNGVAVCEGYACAAKLLLNSYGIECDIEVGYTLSGGGHAWNLVKLDGQWYQLDITWNDESYDRKDYFLVTDTYMKQSRTWKESDYPVCARTAYAA